MGLVSLSFESPQTEEPTLLTNIKSNKGSEDIGNAEQQQQDDQTKQTRYLFNNPFNDSFLTKQKQQQHVSPKGLNVSRVRRRSSLANSETLKDLLNDDTPDDRGIGNNTDETQTKKLCFRCARETNDELANSTRRLSISSSPNQHRRRKSSFFLGSIQESLLSGSQQTLNKSTPFLMKIGINSSFSDVPMVNKSVIIPFDGHFSDSKEDQVLPYVGTVDLEKYFIEREIKKEKLNKNNHVDNDNNEKKKKEKKKKRKFPGFDIPEKGQLQFILYNDEKTVCSVIIFPYDLTTSKLTKNNKRILRQSIYSITKYESDNSKPLVLKELVSTVEIKLMNYKDKSIFLYDSIKVIFHNRIIPNNLPISSELINKKHNTATTTNNNNNTNTDIKIVPCLPKTVRERKFSESSQSSINLSYYLNRCYRCSERHNSSVFGKVHMDDVYHSVFSDEENDND